MKKRDKPKTDMVRFGKKRSEPQDNLDGDEHIPCCVVDDIQQLLRNSLRPIASCVGYVPRRKRLVSFHQGVKPIKPIKPIKTTKRTIGILKKIKPRVTEKRGKRKGVLVKQPSSDSELSHESEEPTVFFRKDSSLDSEVSYGSKECDSSIESFSSDSEASSVCSSASSNTHGNYEDSPRSSDSKLNFFQQKFFSSPDKSNTSINSSEAREDNVSIGNERKTYQLSHMDREDEGANAKTLADPTQKDYSPMNYSDKRETYQTVAFDPYLPPSSSKQKMSSLKATQGSENYHPALQSRDNRKSVGKQLMKVFKKMNPKRKESTRIQGTKNVIAFQPNNDDSISCISANTSRMTLQLPSFLLKGKNKEPNLNQTSNVNGKSSFTKKVRKWGNDDSSRFSKRELLYASPKDYVTNYTRSDFVKRHQQLRKKEKKKFVSSNASTISNVTGLIKSGDKEINCNIRLNSGIKSQRE